MPPNLLINLLTSFFYFLTCHSVLSLVQLQSVFPELILVQHTSHMFLALCLGSLIDFAGNSFSPLALMSAIATCFKFSPFFRTQLNHHLLQQISLTPSPQQKSLPFFVITWELFQFFLSRYQFLPCIKIIWVQAADIQLGHSRKAAPVVKILTRLYIDA